MHYKNQPPSVQYYPAKRYLETKPDSYASEPDSCWNQFYISCYSVGSMEPPPSTPLKTESLGSLLCKCHPTLQSSVWKCHPATLFISSPALVSIIRRSPLEGSHTREEALKCAPFWTFQRPGISGLMCAQPLLKTLRCQSSLQRKKSSNFNIFCFTLKFWRLQFVFVDFWRKKCQVQNDKFLPPPAH